MYQSIEESHAQVRIDRAFRMPLDPEIEATAWSLHSLDDTIFSRCHDVKGAGTGQGLLVPTPHAPRPKRPGHFVFPSILVIGRRWKRIRQELVKRRTGMQTHHLHTEADAQNRLLNTGIKCLEEGSFEGLPPGIDRSRTWIGRTPEILHDGVIATCEDESVASIDEFRDIGRITREDHGQPPRPPNRVQVGRTKCNPAINDIRGQADQWGAGCHDHYIGFTSISPLLLPLEGFSSQVS